MPNKVYVILRDGKLAETTFYYSETKAHNNMANYSHESGMFEVKALNEGESLPSSFRTSIPGRIDR